MADNCSNREQILHKKLEEANDTLRKERLASAAVKQIVVDKENLVDKLRGKIRELEADLNLSKLENEHLIG